MYDISRQLASLSSEQRASVLQELRKQKKQTSLQESSAHRKGSDAFPMSFAQQRLWFLHQLEPENPFYNTFHAIRLTGPLAIHILERSLAELITRHESLRTTFVTERDQFVQCIHPPVLSFPSIDLRALPPARRTSEALLQSHFQATLPFRLDQDRPVRFALLLMDTDEYILLLTMHHIICDGWSLGIFLKELVLLYNAFLEDLPSPLPALPVQYADYALWQKEWLQGAILEKQLEYWRQQLQEVPVLQLPTDFARPAVQRYQGRSYSFTLPASLSLDLQRLSRQEDVTLFMLLLAAFQVLLAHYSGQTDIVLGTPAVNRPRVELEQLIGFFANTLVLRTDLSGNPPFREILKRVRTVCLNAYAHQDIPFEKLVEVLQPDRDMSRTPLFQVLFAFQNTSQPALKLTDLRAEWLPIDNQTAKFDLSLFVEASSEGLSGALEYNTDLFKEATIHRLAGTWQTLLQAIVAQPDLPIQEIPLLTVAEQHQQLVEWNATRQAQAEEVFLHTMFEEQAERTPQAIAVIYGEHHVTYGELHLRSNQLACYLRSQGVKPEVRVGLCMERSLEVVIGLLGILKAGGVYVPLDPTYPEARLTFMLLDAQVEIILTQEHLKQRLPEQARPVLCLDSQWHALATRSDFQAARLFLDNLAYVVYTSGSTGRPKGIAMTHRAIANLIAWGVRNTRLAALARTIQFASPSFDVSLQEMFLTWSSGGTLLLITQEIRRNIEEVAEIMYREAVERLYMPAMALQQLAQVFIRKGIVPCHLHEIIAGSEQLQMTEPITQLLRSLKDAFLRNEYGPSESHVVTAFTLQNTAEEEWTGLPPIGRPVANTEIYILDSALSPLPVGVPGEVYISGAGLARGYLGRPDLTAERFIPALYSDRLGARFYKTGDLALYRPDGTIEFLGRVDHQVKLRGYRIELGEIEAVLTEHPAVRETVVLLQKSRSGDKQLAAYLVVAAGWQLTPATLRTWLRERLPDYMVPSTFMLLDRFPLTAHGKIDRQALAAYTQPQMEISQAYIAPRDEIELQLVSIWEELLPVKPVGVTTDFFSLGGHSLLAVRLMAHIRSRFGYDLPLSVLFQEATIEHLASLLRGPIKTFLRTPLVPIQPGGWKPPFFCIHPIGGEVLCYSPLARLLDSNQPFYGLQYTATHDDSRQARRIEDLAAQYITALKNVQSRGPYRLGGWSMGGLIAFEMAQQLQRQGEEVALLLLIDSYAPSDGDRSVGELNEAALRQQFAEDLAGLPALSTLFSGEELPQYDNAQFFNALYQRIEQIGFLPAKDENADLQKLFQTFKNNTLAMDRYQPEAYFHPLVILQASEHRGAGASQSWQALARGPLLIDIVPGTHYTIMQHPSVVTLANRVQYYLDHALAEHPAGDGRNDDDLDQ